MNARLKSIEHVGEATYRVVLAPPDGELMSYDFYVTGDDIAVVQASPQFTAYVARETGRATPIYRAVLSFHEAQALRY